MLQDGQSLRVLVVGAGPAGFYTIEELSRALSAEGISLSFDLVNKDIRPGGLVVYGVAPDHQKIRKVNDRFEELLHGSSNINYFGNVILGKDFNLADVLDSYDILVLSVGAQSDRALEVPGEDLKGCYSAREFVGWYNGLPELALLDPDLSNETALVIGAGNVALDVARVLVKSPDELAKTDISARALQHLRKSKIKDVFICARRGPAYVKYTPAELKALGELSEVGIKVDPADLELDSFSSEVLSEDKDAAKNFNLYQEFASRNDNCSRNIHFKFLISPSRILGEGSVAQVEFVKNEMFQSKIKPKPGTEFVVDAGLVLKAVGYKVLPLAGVDYDSKNFVIANGQGRVNDHGLYVAGWAADGPSGIIGTNKTRARKVVTEIVKDLPQIKSRHSNKTLDFNLGEFLAGRGVRFVSKEEWQQIDKFEITRGVEQQRVRERFICSQEMLEFLR